MKMKKALSVIAAAAAVFGLCLTGGCAKEQSSGLDNPKYDLSIPSAGADGWYLVFRDDFEGSSLNENIQFGPRYTGNREIWTTSPHAIRWQSDDADKPEQACWWCPEMVEVKDSNAVIHSRYESDHTCSGDCPSQGRFTGGIETRRIVGDSNDNKGTSDEMLFSQAFGYFECRVKFPDSDGLWSAFWLQSSNQRKIGNAGEDGTEIDVFESAFRKCEASQMGHALLWDGYSKHARVADYITELEQDLYDGYHTFALKWTPEYYVFYIDSKPTWATDAGNVSKVREFLRLTVEIDAGNEYGPHGMNIGAFDDKTPAGDFLVDYVLVLQNEDFEQYIKDDSEFEGSLDLN